MVTALVVSVLVICLLLFVLSAWIKEARRAQAEAAFWKNKFRLLNDSPAGAYARGAHPIASSSARLEIETPYPLMPSTFPAKKQSDLLFLAELAIHTAQVNYFREPKKLYMSQADLDEFGKGLKIHGIPVEVAPRVIAV